MGQSDSIGGVVTSSPSSSTPPSPAKAHNNNNNNGILNSGKEQQQQHHHHRDHPDSLQDDLDSLREQLLLKDEEIMRLSRIRGDVEAELEDLTASLFEEAHKMVRYIGLTP